MRRPAILLVGTFSNRTGYAWSNIYRLFNVIARNMHGQGVSVCLSFAQLQPPIEFIDNDVPFECFQFDPRNVTVHTLIMLQKTIRKNNIKFVYFTDLHIFRWFYFFLRIMGVKKIILHSRISVKNPYPASPEKGLRRFIKAAIVWSDWVTPDKVYAVSDFVRNRIIDRNCFSANKVVKILNGINIEKYKDSRQELITDKVHIFVGGRANKHKGIDILIKAADLIVREHEIKNFVIEYAGDGPELNNLVSMVEELGLKQQFIFLGQLADTRASMGRSSIVVVPSVWGDACPSAVSEALASGKPLVTTCAGGIPELVGDENNAVLVPPSDYEALAVALARLIQSKDERDELGKNARVRAVSALDEKHYYDIFIKQLISDLGI